MPVYHFWGWFVVSGFAWLERGSRSRAKARWSGTAPRCAGRMKLDQIRAKIPIRAKHLQGNNLFVRCERGWHGGAGMEWCLLLLCHGRRQWDTEPRLRPAGYQHPAGCDGSNGDGLQMGSLGCRFRSVTSQLCDGSLKALIKNPPPSSHPSGEQRLEGGRGGRACQPVPTVHQVPSPGSSGRSSEVVGYGGSLGAAGIPPSAGGTGMQLPSGFSRMDHFEG